VSADKFSKIIEPLMKNEKQTEANSSVRINFTHENLLTYNIGSYMKSET